MMANRPFMRLAVVVMLLLALRSWIPWSRCAPELGADTDGDDAAGELDSEHQGTGGRRPSTSTGSEPHLPLVSAWDLFRIEHPQVAKVSEYAFMWLLISRRNLASCTRSNVPYPDISIVAWVTIHDGSINIDDIACLPAEASDSDAGQLCSCLLTWLPDAAYAELPEVSDADRAEYEGPLVLPHWTLR